MMPVGISVVIPVYNSERSLEELYQRLTRVLNTETEDYELILVDDASRDRSYAKMKELHNRDPRVKIIRLSRNFGQQHALLCGFHYATGTYVVTMDDDLQHPPEEIPVLLHKIKLGYDAVFGIPAAKKHSRYRNAGTQLINWLLGIISGKPFQIKVSSFRALKGSIVREICQTKVPFIYLAPLILGITKQIANVTVRHEPRKYGNSGYDLRKLIQLTLKLIWYYSAFGKMIPKGNRRQFEIAEIFLK